MIESLELSCGIHYPEDDGPDRCASFLLCAVLTPLLVHVFAGVLRSGWGEVFGSRVVSWIDLRPIVHGSDVASFVFTFDAFVRDDVML